ncbi:hypothetical protein FDZ71_10555 [bacterium]|nr:MAG: hypothetical protein FDZ71_10555 [bacterium]
MEKLFQRHVDVEFMYAFAGFSGAGAVMIFRFRQHEEGVRILREGGARILDAKAFGALDSESGS